MQLQRQRMLTTDNKIKNFGNDNISQKFMNLKLAKKK